MDDTNTDSAEHSGNEPNSDGHKAVSRKALWMVLAAVCAVVILEGCFLAAVALKLRPAWGFGPVRLACSPDGSKALIGASPLRKTYVPPDYYRGLAEEFALQSFALGGHQLNLLRTTPALAWKPLGDLTGTTWMNNGQAAFFEGFPTDLTIADPTDGQTLHRIPLQQLNEKAKVGLMVGRADVMDSMGSLVLCRLLPMERPHPGDKPCRFVLVDSRSGVVKLVIPATQTDSDTAQERRTGCILNDKSLIVVNGSTAMRVAPDGRTAPFHPEVKNVTSVCLDRSRNQVLILSWKAYAKDRAIYSFDLTEHRPAIIVHGPWSWALSGPNGELIAGTRQQRLRMVYPKELELGPSPTFISAIGGTADRLVLWTYNGFNGSLTADVRDVKRDYAPVSHAVYTRPLVQVLLAMNNWGRVLSAMGWVLLRLVAVLAVVALAWKYLPRRFSGWVAGFALFFGTYFYVFGPVMRLVVGRPSPGRILYLDVFIGASLAIAWFINSRVRLGMEKNGWKVPKSASAWIACGLLFPLWLLLDANGLRLGAVDWWSLPSILAFNFAIGVLWEEFIFRGVMWETLTKMGWRVPLVLTAQAAIFTAAHLASPHSTVFYGQAFLMGATLGFARWKSGSLVPGLIGHALINVVSMAMVIHQ